MLADLATGPSGSNPYSLTTVGNKVYFGARTGAVGTELFESDGTTAGTKLALDISPGTRSSTPNYMTSFQGRLVFRATTSTHGTELRAWDGRAATATVFDLQPGAASSSPRSSNTYHSDDRSGFYRFLASGGALFHYPFPDSDLRGVV